MWKSLVGSRREPCLQRTERRSSGKQDSGAWKTEPQAPLTAEISRLFVSEGRAWLPLPSIWTAGQQQVRATAPLLPPLLALRSSRQMATASGLGHGSLHTSAGSFCAGLGGGGAQAVPASRFEIRLSWSELKMGLWCVVSQGGPGCPGTGPKVRVGRSRRHMSLT